MKRSEVAEELGKHKSFVTQALSSGRNLTLTSLASLLWAAGYRLEPQLVSIAKGDGKEEMHPVRLVRCNESYEVSNDNIQDIGDSPGHETVFEAVG